MRQWAAALALHEEMRGAGHALNTTSYNALISAHSKAGELPAVLETYQRMVQQARAPPAVLRLLPEGVSAVRGVGKRAPAGPLPLPAAV